jgi:2-hydroxychromene-2-carboxylate isomerase
VNKELQFYFDFLSPFAYFVLECIDRLPQGTTLVYKPVLFAGLLKHWGQKGPAEIQTKRSFTHRHLQWIAGKHNIPYRMPPAHPFNPLGVLRLSIALNNDPDVVRAIFRFIWRDGKRPDDPDSWNELIQALKVTDVDQRIAASAVKDQLHRNCDEAIKRGVFGVPTFLVNDELFWGFDAFDFLIDYLRDPTVLNNDEMRRISALPVGVERPR